MSDEPQMIHGIDWRRTFPFVQIFRSFRIATRPSKLVLALIAMLLIYLGGTILDGVWNLSPKDRAVPGEVSLYIASQAQPNPHAWFIDQRDDAQKEIDENYRLMLAQVPKKDPTLKDLEWYIKNQRDHFVADIEAAYEKSPKKDDDLRRRDEQIRATYEEASRAWRRAHDHERSGLFRTLLDHEVGELNSMVRMVRMGNFFGAGGMSDSLISFFAWGPMWAISQHYVFFTIFGLYFLIIWSIFGGAIARIAAVHIAVEDTISIRQALAFSSNKFLSFLSAPLIPLVLIGLMGLLVAAGGFIGNLPGLGPVVVGALFFLALIAGVVMALGLIGLIGGINLMYPTIAVEGSDSFDAVSRAYSYLYGRPWRLIFYSLVALIYGAICYIFVRCFIYLALWLTHLFAGLWFFYSASNTAPLFSTMWPDPWAYGQLRYDIDFLTLTPLQALGAWLMAFWIYLVIALLGAFAICFYFTANTIIYYLLRNEVDSTELDDVYLEQTDEDFGETTTVIVATTDATDESKTTDATASEATTADQPPPDSAPAS